MKVWVPPHLGWIAEGARMKEQDEIWTQNNKELLILSVMLFKTWSNSSILVLDSSGIFLLLPFQSTLVVAANLKVFKVQLQPKLSDKSWTGSNPKGFLTLDTFEKICRYASFMKSLLPPLAHTHDTSLTLRSVIWPKMPTILYMC